MTGPIQPLCPPVQVEHLREVASARVLYADTDKLGIVYHASYLRYMELGRVEFIRGCGMPYTRMEALGLALPLTDVAVRYVTPARYDQRMTIAVGVSRLSWVRVHFDYRFAVDGAEVLTAQTRHACVRIADGRPDRLPAEVHDVLSRQLGTWSPP
jgi:acyl-CoA thioester hydrolase